MQAALQKLKFFLETFPTLTSLAIASEQNVLQAFSGLGYYRRAKNLHKGAQYILQKYGENHFPSNYQELMAIPGIGDYTASAILSIAFNQPILSIDTNIIRIFQRLSSTTSLILNSKTRKDIHHFFSPFFKKNHSHHNGEINEALMQLGQKICTHKNPKCNSCPLRLVCLAFLRKENLDLLTKKNQQVKKEKIEVTWHIFILEFCDKEILLIKLHKFYFLDQHNGLPSQLVFTKKHDLKNKMESDPVGGILFSFQKENKDNPFFKENFVLVKTFRHTITHHVITAKVWNIQKNALPKPLQKEIMQKTKENRSCQKISIAKAKDLFSSSLFLKVFREN